MRIEEFNARRMRSETADAVYLDVRPFHDRQGEAIESYLGSCSGLLKLASQRRKMKKVVLLCDAGTLIPEVAHDWLKRFRAAGMRIEVKPLAQRLHLDTNRC